MEAAISSEKAARQAADAALVSALGTESSNRSADVSVEEAGMSSAKAAAIAANTAEEGVRSAAVDAEEALRISGDNDIQAEIDAETAARGTAQTNQTTARGDADSSIDTLVTAESNDRVNGDAVEQAGIDAFAAKFQFDGDGSEGGVFKLEDGADKVHLVFELNTDDALDEVMLLEIQSA
jgi:predicted peptidase